MWIRQSVTVIGDEHNFLLQQYFKKEDELKFSNLQVEVLLKQKVLQYVQHNLLWIDR